MKKPFRDTEVWKLLRTTLEMILLVLVIMVLVHACEWLVGQAHAENAPERRWVFCADTLLVREGPGKNRFATGELEPGTMVVTDGKKKNGYTHIIGIANESGEGWVRSVYLADEEPTRVDCIGTVISAGRLAARRSVGGERKNWLKPGSTVKVSWITSEWCVTNKGYVMLEYIDLTDGE